MNQPVLRVTELPNRSPLPAAHSHSHSSIFKRTNFSSHFSFQGIQIDRSDRWTFISKAIYSCQRTSILAISREKINLNWIPPKITSALFRQSLSDCRDIWIRCNIDIYRKNIDKKSLYFFPENVNGKKLTVWRWAATFSLQSAFNSDCHSLVLDRFFSKLMKISLWVINIRIKYLL